MIPRLPPSTVFLLSIDGWFCHSKKTLEFPEHFRPRSDVIFEIPFDLGDPLRRSAQ